MTTPTEADMPVTNIIGLDPGTTQSAWCWLENGKVKAFELEPNGRVLAFLELSRVWATPAPVLVVERIESYGMSVGTTIFETVWWSGRFHQIYQGQAERLTRRAIKLHLCGTARAKDANVRQALLDRFSPSGGGKTPQVGVKAKPGPLYGVSRDIWAALAVAVTYQEMENES